MKILIALLSAFLVAGCMPPAKIATPQAMTAQEQAQALINEANIMITAAANVITENYNAGILPHEEALAYAQKLVGYAMQVDHAQAALRSGVPEAADQAKLLKELVSVLHKEIAAKARQKP